MVVAVSDGAVAVYHESAYSAGCEIGGGDVGIVGAVLYGAHIERSYRANVVVASDVVVLAENDVLHHTVLVDASEQGVILTFSIIAVLGVIYAADGVAVAVKRSVKAIGYLCNLGVAVLAYGRQLYGTFGSASEVDVVGHLEILARSLVLGIAVLCHCLEVGCCAYEIWVGCCASAGKSPCFAYCRAVALCHGCHRCYACEDKSKDFLHIIVLFFKLLLKCCC